MQKMFYNQENQLKALVLFDILERPVALKMFDEQFSESWDMSDSKTQEKLEILYAK